jgi:hypothetical protein
VADWYEDDSARDPMEIDTKEVPLPATDGDNEDPIPAPSKSPKAPVKVEDIESAGDEETEAKAS